MSHSALVGEVLERIAADRGDRLAVREAQRDWSYSDLAGSSRAIADGLADACPGSGRTIGLMLPNSGAFVASFAAITRSGCVVAPLNCRYGSQELSYYLRDSRAAALVVATELLDRVVPALKAMERSPALLAVDPAGKPRLIDPGGMADSPPPNAASDALLLQYTSGSTGAPKRVIRTQANLLFELERLARSFELGERDRFLGVAPFSHVNGLVRTMMASIFVGGTLYPVPSFQRREMLDLITRERLTYFGGVPYMFVVLGETPARSRVDLDSLRTVFSASAPLLPADNRRFRDRYGLFVRQLYGSSETGTIAINLRPDLETSLSSVGLPLDGIRIEILDEERRPVPPGEEGEVTIASPGAISAYDGNDEATSRSFRDGFYYSGDLGYRDGDGMLTLSGRKKFLINRGGFKVNPYEVEEAIRSHPKVADVVVFGAPSAHGDEIVRCAVIAREPCTASELVQHCRTRIADFKVPSEIEFRSELPKTETGKVLRHKLT